MKLHKVDFYLDWPVTIEVKTLRRYIIANLLKEGQVIRWSIIDIQNSLDNNNKKLRIQAVLAF